MREQDTLNRSRLRWLFAIIFLGLVTQWLFISVIQEPYPAIVYPAFTALAVHEGHIEDNRTEIVIRSKTQAPVRVDAQRFFQSLPQSFVKFVLATIDQRTEQTASKVRLRVGPYQFEIKKTLYQDASMVNAFHQWLDQEISRTLQIDEPTQLTINLYQDQLDRAGHRLGQEKLLHSTTIDLHRGEKR